MSTYCNYWVGLRPPLTLFTEHCVIAPYDLTHQNQKPKRKQVLPVMVV